MQQLGETSRHPCIRFCLSRGEATAPEYRSSCEPSRSLIDTAQKRSDLHSRVFVLHCHAPLHTTDARLVVACLNCFLSHHPSRLHKSVNCAFVFGAPHRALPVSIFANSDIRSVIKARTLYRRRGSENNGTHMEFLHTSECHCTFHFSRSAEAGVVS